MTSKSNDIAVATSDTHELVYPKRKPSPEEISDLARKYFDSQSSNYDEFDKQFERRHKFIATVNSIVISDLQKSVATKRILSVGCGTGRREKEIMNALNGRVAITGIELSEEMAKIARSNSLECLVGELVNLDLPSNSFDASFYFFSFEHVPSAYLRKKYLHAIFTSLRSGATLYIDALNLDDRGEWGPTIRAAFTDHSLENRGYELGDLFYRRVGGEELSFFHYFSEEEVIQLLLEAGFVKPSVTYIGYSIHPGEIASSGKTAALFFKTTKP